MGTVIGIDQPQDTLTRREMLRLSAAGMTALQGTALFAPVATPAAATSSPVTVVADHHFEPIPDEHTFNLVPGFEAVPPIVAIQPGNEVGMRIEASGA